MAASHKTMEEIHAQTQRKKELIQLTKGLKMKANQDAQDLSVTPEVHMSEEQRQRFKAAEDEYDHAVMVIENTELELKQLQLQLKSSVKPVGDNHSELSTESSVKVIQAKAKEVLVEMEIAYHNDKQKLQDKIEDLEEELITAGKEEDRNHFEKEVRKFKKKLTRLERDYPMKCDHVKKRSEAAMNRVRVEHEEEDLERTSIPFPTANESVARVRNWMTESGAPVPPPAPVIQQQLEAEQQVSQPVRVVQAPATPTPSQPPAQMDERQLMMTLLQNQLQLLNTKSASTSERNLPKFAGDPAQWGIFKSAVDRTQSKFSFDNGENLGRFREALQGPAFEAVKHLLQNEDNVVEILRVLDMRYGRPECVLNYLVEKAKQTPRPDTSKPETVVDFGTAVHALVTNIISYKRPSYMLNPQLVEELVEKLPGSLKGAWYDHRVAANITEVDLQQFSTWLDRKVESALLQVKYTVGTADIDAEEKRSCSRRNLGAINGAGGEVKQPGKACPCCALRGHGLHNCWSLKNKPIEERWNIVKSAKVCFTCLHENHTSRDCPESKDCGINGCKRKHHRLLHGEEKDDIGNRPAAADNGDGEGGSFNSAVSIVEGTDGPLPIVPVRLRGKAGVRVSYALLDSGATRTILTKKLASDLGLEGPPINYIYRTFSGEIVESKGAKKVSLEVSGKYKFAKMYPLTDAVTVDNVGFSPYSINVDAAKRKWPHLRRFKGPSLEKVVPEIVIGGDHGYLMMHRDLLFTTMKEPVAMRTVLGWIMQGKLSGANQVGSSFYMGGVDLDPTPNQLAEESPRFHEASKANENVCMSRQGQEILPEMEGTMKQFDIGGACGEKFRKEQTLMTALMAVENTVNSRPLSFVSDDEGDPVSLTPNHFIRGVGVSSLGPESQAVASGPQFLGAEVPKEKECWRRQWKKAQANAKQFWNRWSIEVSLDNQQPRGEWAKVEDAMVRNFHTKTPSVYRRAVAKICPLGIRCGDLTTASGVQIRGAAMEEKQEAKRRTEAAIECDVAVRDEARRDGPKTWPLTS